MVADPQAYAVGLLPYAPFGLGSIEPVRFTGSVRVVEKGTHKECPYPILFAERYALVSQHRHLTPGTRHPAIVRLELGKG